MASERYNSYVNKLLNHMETIYISGLHFQRAPDTAIQWIGVQKTNYVIHWWDSDFSAGG